MAKEEINKTQIRYSVETNFVCGRCNVLALAFGKMITGGCECCDLLMPFEAPLKIYNSGPMCILRDVPVLDSISSVVR